MHHVGEPHSYPKWEEADWAAVEDSLFDDGQDITGTTDAFVSQKGDILLVWQEDGNPFKLWGNTYRFSPADDQGWTAAEAAADDFQELLLGADPMSEGWYEEKSSRIDGAGTLLGVFKPDMTFFATTSSLDRSMLQRDEHGIIELTDLSACFAQGFDEWIAELDEDSPARAAVGQFAELLGVDIERNNEEPDLSER